MKKPKNGKMATSVAMAHMRNVAFGPKACKDPRVAMRKLEARDDAGMEAAAQAKRDRKNAKRAGK